MRVERAETEYGGKVTVMTCPTCHSSTVRETSVLMKPHSLTVKFICASCSTQFAVDYLAVRATWFQHINERLLAMQVLKHWFA